MVFHSGPQTVILSARVSALHWQTGRLQWVLCRFGAVWQSGASYLSAHPCLINYHHHEMILQGRYDLSGLEWFVWSDDCGSGDEELERLFSWLVDLQIGDIYLFILGACQLHRTAAPTMKQTTGKQIPLQEGKHCGLSGKSGATLLHHQSGCLKQQHTVNPTNIVSSVHLSSLVCLHWALCNVENTMIHLHTLLLTRPKQAASKTFVLLKEEKHM